MNITLEKINTRSDPYQLFLDSIRSPSTKRRYKNLLYTFLKLIPNQLYVDSLNKTPKNREVKTLAKFFVELAKKNQDLASDVQPTVNGIPRGVYEVEFLYQPAHWMVSGEHSLNVS